MTGPTNYEPGFREKFFANVMPEPMSGCWLWTGAVNTSRASAAAGEFLPAGSGLISGALAQADNGQPERAPKDWDTRSSPSNDNSRANDPWSDWPAELCACSDHAMAVATP